jgi:hypothetical protein
MASGALPKRVRCPNCGAVEGLACVDKAGGTYKTMPKPHKERYVAAEVWYETKSPDGLTPKRRDEMVEHLRDYLGKGKVGMAMEKITRSADPEAEYKRLVG